MHDFTYFEDCNEISVGVSCCKSVPASTFAEEWENNRESLYKYMEEVHLGVKGIVRKDGKPIKDALILPPEINLARTNERGEYWRLILPGNYPYLKVLNA